ncbi:MAG: hypothetical protein ACFB6S_06695 [Geminicoccaceae bacterium]
MVRQRWRVAAIWGFVALALVMIVAPFAWIVVISLKYQIQILMGQFPFEPTWVNYQSVLFGKSSDFLRNLANSLIVGVANTVCVLIVGTLAAYSLSWRRWSQLFKRLF